MGPLPEERSPDPIDDLVARWRKGQEPTPESLRAVSQVLMAWLAKRRLDPRDCEEVVADATNRLLIAVRAGRLDPSRPPGAWLRVVADNLALDMLRRHRPSATLPEEGAMADTREDDRIAALLDASAAAEDVSRAIREAAANGKFDLVRIVATWLDLAEATGEAPSNREVAARLGVSHMTVQRGLRAFAQWLSR